MNITTETNLHITEYLDVTFNLKTESNSLQYIHKKSNHPPTIIKRIPSIISKRLSDISRNKEHFEKAAPIYNEALKNSGFNEILKFSPSIPTKRLCERNITWSNPSFSSNIKTIFRKAIFSPLTETFPMTS